VTAPIEDVSSLPGKKVSDQQGASIGKVKEI
jgi:sporulation protein YlmC with PRC-barrel domain